VRKWICVRAGYESDGSGRRLKAHLAKRGFGDIEVNVTGGYDQRPRQWMLDFARGKPCMAARELILSKCRASQLLARICFHRRAAENAASHFGLGHGTERTRLTNII